MVSLAEVGRVFFFFFFLMPHLVSKNRMLLLQSNPNIKYVPWTALNPNVIFLLVEPQKRMSASKE